MLVSMLVYNAAGPRSKELSDIQALLLTSIPKVTIGSITLEPGKGNPGTTFWKNAGTTLNSVGLKNRGLAYYEKTLSRIIGSINKKLRASIASDAPSGYAKLAAAFLRLGIEEIEVNASCPNVWKAGKQKSIATYDGELLTTIIKALEKVSSRKVFDIKLSPISDPTALRSVARIIAGARHVRAVVTSNTFPNAYDEHIGLAGMGGAALRHIALGQVRQFRVLLPKRIVIVGVGGISTHEHIRQFHRAGADEVQIGSYYFEKGPGVFAKL